MKSSTLVLAALLAAAPLAPAWAQRAATFSDGVKAFVTTDAPVIAIRDIRVVPRDGGPAREGQTIVVRVGTLEPGKRADIVLVRGEPDRNITDLREIETVFRDGIAYDSAKLVESVRGMVGR